MRALREVGRGEVEEFLVEEAALLDAWHLVEWRRLFDAECRYYVPNPSGDPYAAPDASLYLIADDAHHLTERVKRLGKRTAHAEFPHSKTHRMISNVRVLKRDIEVLRAESKFITHRTSQGITDVYFGRHEYQLAMPENALLIREKRTILAMDGLRPQGKLSIIV